MSPLCGISVNGWASDVHTRMGERRLKAPGQGVTRGEDAFVRAKGLLSFARCASPLASRRYAPVAPLLFMEPCDL